VALLSKQCSNTGKSILDNQKRGFGKPVIVTWEVDNCEDLQRHTCDYPGGTLVFSDLFDIQEVWQIFRTTTPNANENDDETIRPTMGLDD
jgi:hypothetical protein